MVNIIEDILQIKDPFTMEDIYRKFPNTPRARLQGIMNELCKTGKVFFWDKYIVMRYLSEEVEEQKQKYLSSISEETGVNFFDIQ